MNTDAAERTAPSERAVGWAVLFAKLSDCVSEGGWDIAVRNRGRQACAVRGSAEAAFSFGGVAAVRAASIRPLPARAA